MRPMEPGQDGPSEMSWGRGLDPPGCSDRSVLPRDGGRYQPLSPPEEFDPFVNMPNPNTPFTGGS